jgi:DNA (cytosine-5)-methyltransferase 1
MVLDIKLRRLKMAEYKAIDLFAGIGGIRLGFDQAFGDDIQTVFVSEIDKRAQETYKANFEDTQEITGDITKVKVQDVPEFDICLAGFPCQAFSVAGKREGFYDEKNGQSRGVLFFDVARICVYHKPKVLFCENVKGLINHDGKRTFEFIKTVLKANGYKLYTKLLNSKNFGVPQNRERIYIVAFRDDIDSSSFSFPKLQKEIPKLADILEKEPVPAKYYISASYVQTLRNHRARHEAKGNGFGYIIRSLDSTAGTLVSGPMGRDRNLIIDGRQTDLTPTTNIKGEINREGIRKFTPRECARLQGFPEDYKLTLADTHLYKQFANSVTVPVIRAIAENIYQVLKKN